MAPGYKSIFSLGQGQNAFHSMHEFAVCMLRKGREPFACLLCGLFVLTLFSGCSSSLAGLDGMGSAYTEKEQGSAEAPSDERVLIFDSTSEGNGSLEEERSSPDVSEAHAEPDEAALEPSQSTKMDEAQSAVAKLVAPYGQDVAVAVKLIGQDDAGFSLNGEAQFVAASMIKLLVLAEFIDEVDTASIRLDDTYTRSSDDVVGGTGQIVNEASATEYTYDDLARYMIMYSDNTAANVLIDILGFDDINAKAKDLGLTATDLSRKMMDTGSGVENHTSAEDVAAILEGIATHTCASVEMCEKAQSYLLLQTDNAGIAEGIPFGVDFGHKTGSLNDVRHDGGIVYADEPYVIVVLCDIGASEANALMAEISAAVYSALEEAPS